MTQAVTIRTARERLEPPLTQEVLAAAVGVDQTYISLIERGLRTPSDGLKERLANALGIAPARLRFRNAQPSHTVRPRRDRTGQSVTRSVISDDEGSAVSSREVA